MAYNIYKTYLAVNSKKDRVTDYSRCKKYIFSPDVVYFCKSHEAMPLFLGYVLDRVAKALNSGGKHTSSIHSASNAMSIKLRARKGKHIEVTLDNTQDFEKSIDTLVYSFHTKNGFEQNFCVEFDLTFNQNAQAWVLSHPAGL